MITMIVMHCFEPVLLVCLFCVLISPLLVSFLFCIIFAIFIITYHVSLF